MCSATIEKMSTQGEAHMPRTWVPTSTPEQGSREWVTPALFRPPQLAGTRPHTANTSALLKTQVCSSQSEGMKREGRQ